MGAASGRRIRRQRCANPQGEGLFPEHDGPHLYGAIILAYNGEAAKAAELANELAGRSRISTSPLPSTPMRWPAPGAAMRRARCSTGCNGWAASAS